MVARLDFAYPEILLAIEADGFRHHGDKAGWNRDLARRNALTALGWRVIHVTWDDLRERPREIVRHLREAIQKPLSLPSFRA